MNFDIVYILKLILLFILFVKLILLMLLYLMLPLSYLLSILLISMYINLSHSSELGGYSLKILNQYGHQNLHLFRIIQVLFMLIIIICLIRFLFIVLVQNGQARAIEFIFITLLYLVSFSIVFRPFSVISLIIIHLERIIRVLLILQSSLLFIVLILHGNSQGMEYCIFLRVTQHMMR